MCEYYVLECINKNASNYGSSTEKENRSCILFGNDNLENKNNNSQDDINVLNTTITVDIITVGVCIYEKIRKNN